MTDRRKPPHRIDVHHHIFPPEWVKATASHGIGEAGGVAFPAWTPASQIEFMDRQGIAAAVTSVAAPGVHFGDDRAARSLARTCNESSARLIADAPSRLGAFGVLPLPDVDGSLLEIETIYDQLHLDGVILLASIGERYLGDPAFDAVFDELNRRKAVVFIHPTVPVTSRALRLAMPGALIEFVFDTTRAVANLIYSGTLERCPDLRIILSHAGGTVPFLAGRLTLGDLVPALRQNAPQGSTAYLKRLYYDTAISANPYTLNSLQELVDPSHILFGSDTPYLPEPLVAGQIDGLAGYRGFDDRTRGMVERDNALALFPRLRVRS
ncbi:MAG TPA: amidohydrolase family protein [Verrucomicrobiae bacterium]|nr:amidohydrolase family protein [Verrucomicrobiae bacterium]